MTRTDSIYFSLPCDRYTPFSLARKIGATAILESASFARGKERYSILLLEPAFHIVQDEEGVAFLIDGRRLPYKGKNTTGETIAPGSRVLHTPDILDALLYVAEQNDLTVVRDEDGNESPNSIPVPSSGLGYLSYEFAARCDTIDMAPQTDELHIPESEFIAGHVYIVFDHFTEKLHVFALNYNEHQIDLDKAVADLKARLNDMDFTYLSQPEEPKPVSIQGPKSVGASSASSRKCSTSRRISFSPVTGKGKPSTAYRIAGVKSSSMDKVPNRARSSAQAFGAPGTITGSHPSEGTSLKPFFRTSSRLSAFGDTPEPSSP